MDVDAVLRADRRFFEALLSADGAALDEVLADGFVIVDLGSGSVTSRERFRTAVTDREVHFVTIEVTEDALVRPAGTAAVVVGRTAMEVALPDGSRTCADSRYTHVFVPAGGGWRLHSAQGTRISG